MYVQVHLLLFVPTCYEASFLLSGLFILPDLQTVGFHMKHWQVWKDVTIVGRDSILSYSWTLGLTEPSEIKYKTTKLWLGNQTFHISYIFDGYLFFLFHFYLVSIDI